MFCAFGNALYEWNVTKTDFCAYFNVTGKYILCLCLCLSVCFSPSLSLFFSLFLAC